MLDLAINIQCAGLAGVFVPDPRVKHEGLRDALRKHALRPMRQRTAGRIAMRHLLACTLIAVSTITLAAQTGDLGSLVGSPRSSSLVHAGLVFVAIYAAVLLVEVPLGSVRHAGALAQYVEFPPRRATNPARWWLFNMLRMVTTSTPSRAERVAQIDQLIDCDTSSMERADLVAFEDALSKPPAGSVKGRLDSESLRFTFGVASLGRFIRHVVLLLLSFFACLVLVSLRWPAT